MDDETNIVTRAADSLGGKAALARALGISYQAVHQWEQAGYVPPRSIQKVATETGIKATEFYEAYERHQASREAA